MTNADDASLGRHFTVAAQAHVVWEGQDRGSATWFFYRADPLPESLDNLWRDAGIWEHDFRWDPACRLGVKFFRLCQAELLTIGEANRVVGLVKRNLPQWTNPIIGRIDDTEIRGDLPARMVSSPNGTVVQRDFGHLRDRLGFPVSGFAEPAHPGLGHPIGWYGWPCRQNDAS